MKKQINYIFAAILNLIGGVAFLLAGIFAENLLPKYGFYIASMLLIVSGVGFIITQLKNKRNESKPCED